VPMPVLADTFQDLTAQEINSLKARPKCEQEDYAFPNACEIAKGFAAAGTADLEALADGALLGVSYNITPEGLVMTPELAALSIHVLTSPAHSAEGQKAIEANVDAISKYYLPALDIQRARVNFFVVQTDDLKGQDAIRETLKELVFKVDFSKDSDLYKSLQSRYGIDLYPVFKTSGNSLLAAQSNAVLIRQKGDWVYVIETAWLPEMRKEGPLWLAAFRAEKDSPKK